MCSDGTYVTVLKFFRVLFQSSFVPFAVVN